MEKRKFLIITSGDGKNRDLVSQCYYYVALVTPDFVKDDRCLGEMRDANALKKPMYGLVKHKTELPEYFFDLNWKLILYFDTDKEFRMAGSFLKQILGESFS